MSELSVEDAVREVVSAWPGVRSWWSEVFIGLGLAPNEVRGFLSAQSVNSSSLLRTNRESDLCVSVRRYADERGIKLEAVVDSPVEKDMRVPYIVRQSLTPAEQELVLREVSSHSRVTFKPSRSVTCYDHSVARAIKGVCFNMMRGLIPADARVLEMGAKIVSLILSGVDEERYHGYSPVLGARDAGRHSVNTQIVRISKGSVNGYSAAQAKLAKSFLADPSKLISYCRIQDDYRQGEYILADHSSYDIDMDEVPAIMAQHGTRMWIGSLMRVKGISSFTKTCKGEVPALAARYSVDTSDDSIEFHFRGRSSLSYKHKLSSYVKWEERNDYRYRGVYDDYVYTKMPGTSESVLIYSVVRVKKAFEDFVESRYVPTGLSGKVRVKTLRVAKLGDKWKVYPYDFVVDRIALDKVLEYRRSLGVRGNIRSTMSYIRSVRVKFFLHGVPVGASEEIPSDLFEGLAVFVEATVSAHRAGSDFDLVKLMAGVQQDDGFFSSLASSVLDMVGARVSDPVLGSLRSWRGALERFCAAGLVDYPVSEVCEEFVKVSSGGAFVSEVKPPRVGCVCRELTEVYQILERPVGYSKVEIEELTKYKGLLLERREECNCHLRMDDFSGMHFGEESSEGSTVVEDDDDEESEFFDASERLRSSEFPISERARAVREFADVSKYVHEAVISESKKVAKMVFLNGVPSMYELEKFRTSRVVPLLVKVVSGKIDTIKGEESIKSVAGIISVDTGDFVSVVNKGNSMIVEGVPDGWHYSSSQMKIMNGASLAAVASDVLSGDYNLSGVDVLPLSFVVGPFGAGKTTRIAKEIFSDVSKGVVVGYFAFSKASVDVMKKKLSDFGVDPKFCHTLDSFALHRTEKYDKVYVDEAPAAHFGQHLLCLAKCQAAVCIMYGDFNQIPYCSFTAEFPTPLASLRPFVEVVEAMTKCHRTPADALAMWSQEYEYGLVACECCPHVRDNVDSFSVERISDVSQVPNLEGVRYLTFTQLEKEKLHQYLGRSASIEVMKLDDTGGLSTVHEVQGGSFDKVFIVRTNAGYERSASEQSPSIYNRMAYVLVATTRHKFECRYYTCSDENDLLVRSIVSGRTSEKLQNVLKV